MIRVILLFLLATSSMAAEDNSYWSIEIPAVNGATNLLHEKDERFFVISSSYDLAISNTQDVYDFYNRFFESLGWENPLKSSPNAMNEYKGKWNSYRSAFNAEGLPESSYASMWKSKTIPQ